MTSSRPESASNRGKAASDKVSAEVDAPVSLLLGVVAAALSRECYVSDWANVYFFSGILT